MIQLRNHFSMVVTQLVKTAVLPALRCTYPYRKPYLKLNDVLITDILREGGDLLFLS